MKKVLIGMITDSEVGGIERYIYDFYDVIKDNNITIDFLTSRFTEDVANKFKSQGHNLITCPRMSNPIKLYKFIKSLVQTEKYDVVYFNYSNALGAPAVWAAKKGGAKKVVIHSHSSNFSDSNQIKEIIFKIIHIIARPMLCKNTDCFAACSDKAAQWLFGKKTLKNKKIYYIKNTVDNAGLQQSPEKRESYRSRYGVEDFFVIGNVGRMVKVKNQRFLIELMPLLLKQMPNARLMLVGDGEDKQMLQETAKKLSVSEYVVFTGQLNTTDGIMNAFDVFCLPSLFEGLPYVVVEAQNINLPCILSDKITEQTALTDACSFVPLKYDKWTTEIIKSAEINRNNIKTITQKDSESFIDKTAFAKTLDIFEESIK